MMTTKKRLSDLLREEAQESPSEAEAIQEAASELLEPDPTLSESEPSYETTAALRNKRTSPTKAELEATVIELREALQAAYSKENFLQQQIATLQSDLQEQKISVQKLQAALEQINQIKAELEQAKKVILQLSDDNSKTTQEANTPKKENKGLSPQKLALKKLPHQSIQSDSTSNETFETNVGWFD